MTRSKKDNSSYDIPLCLCLYYSQQNHRRGTEHDGTVGGGGGIGYHGYMHNTPADFK